MQSKDFPGKRLRLFVVRHEAANYMLNGSEVKDHFMPGHGNAPMPPRATLDPPIGVHNLRRAPFDWRTFAS